ncbi:hypothetical protein EBZ38_03815 [bacterium]|nr:hypothetical protein [bacterium]NDD83394.1 hypothetical protein [bacterium]
MRVIYPSTNPKVGDLNDLRTMAIALRAVLDGNIIFQSLFRVGIKSITSIDSPYSLTGISTLLCNASGGAITVNLPPAVDYRGVIFTVKKTDSSANTVTLDGNGAETIDGTATKSISSAYGSIRVISDGTAWFTI